MIIGDDDVSIDLSEFIDETLLSMTLLLLLLLLLLQQLRLPVVKLRSPVQAASPSTALHAFIINTKTKTIKKSNYNPRDVLTVSFISLYVLLTRKTIWSISPLRMYRHASTPQERRPTHISSRAGMTAELISDCINIYRQIEVQTNS